MPNKTKELTKSPAEIYTFMMRRFRGDRKRSDLFKCMQDVDNQLVLIFRAFADVDLQHCAAKMFQNPSHALDVAIEKCGRNVQTYPEISGVDIRILLDQHPALQNEELRVLASKSGQLTDQELYRFSQFYLTLDLNAESMDAIYRLKNRIEPKKFVTMLSCPSEKIWQEMAEKNICHFEVALAKGLFFLIREIATREMSPLEREIAFPYISGFEKTIDKDASFAKTVLEAIKTQGDLDFILFHLRYPDKIIALFVCLADIKVLTPTNRDVIKKQIAQHPQYVDIFVGFLLKASKDNLWARIAPSGWQVVFTQIETLLNSKPIQKILSRKGDEKIKNALYDETILNRKFDKILAAVIPAPIQVRWHAKYPGSETVLHLGEQFTMFTSKRPQVEKVVGQVPQQQNRP